MALNFQTPPTCLSEPTCAPSAVCTATTAALMGSSCKGPATGPGGTWAKVGVNGGVMDGLWWCCSFLDEIGLRRLMDKRKQLLILKLKRLWWSLTRNQVDSSRS